MERKEGQDDAGFAETVVSGEKNAFVETNRGIHDVVQNGGHQGVVCDIQAGKRALERSQ